jgi:hypothetical protein
VFATGGLEEVEEKPWEHPDKKEIPKRPARTTMKISRMKAPRKVAGVAAPLHGRRPR